MRNSRFKRTLRSGARVTAGLLLPLAMVPTAFSQPPSPTAEVTGDRPAAGQQNPDRTEFEQAEGVEYLTRGPLHEAFAEPYEANPAPGPVIAKQPPEPIEEVPPQYRPDGDQVTWIPGYWSWDDERNDFIWISGVWRDLPPGQQWVPGYWDQASDGYQYVGGFWASNKTAEVEYLPPPPESLDQGPSSPAPGDNYFYVPGYWVYESNDYRWQPGFWSAGHENWVWVPAQYVWTPRGCVYQAGYWDYDVAHRGVVFTPVYYQQPIYRNPGYAYRPRYTIDTGASLFVHLFVRPNHRHYYYGDYYGSQYSNTYYPWVNRYQGPQYYDPFYANYRYRSRAGSGNNLLAWIGSQFQTFARNDRYRPPRTIDAQREFLRTNQNADIDQTTLRLTSLGDSLDNLVRTNDSGLSFQTLDNAEIDRVRKATDPLRQLVRDRLQIENSSASSNADVSAEANGEVNRGNLEARVNANADGSATGRTGENGKPRGDARAQASGNGQATLRLPSRADLNTASGGLEQAARELLDAGRNEANEKKQSDLATDRLDAAQELRRNMSQQTREAGESAREATREARESAREVTREAGESAREAGQSVRGAGESAREMTRDAGESAREATRGAGDSAREAGESAREVTRDARESAREATRGAGDSVRGAGESAREMTRETGESAREAEQSVRGAEQGAREAGQSVRENAQNAERATRNAIDANRMREQAGRQGSDLLRRAGGEASDRSEAIERMRPALPEDWPSQFRPQPNRALPNRPDSGGAPRPPRNPVPGNPATGNLVPGNPAQGGEAAGRRNLPGSVSPGNLSPGNGNRGIQRNLNVPGNSGAPGGGRGILGNPQRAIPSPSTPNVPPVQGGLQNATEGASGAAGGAVEKAIGDLLGG